MPRASRPARGNSRRSGNSLVEFALFAPWYFLLFAGVVNTGFVIYGLIAVQNAARVAALHTAENRYTASDRDGACVLVMRELKGLPAVDSNAPAGCASDPVTLAANYCDATTPCTGSATSIDNGPAAFVAVTYRMPPLFRLPVSAPAAITRTVEVRLRDPLP